MKITEAVEIIKEYNEWRRGDIKDLRYSPKTIGIAIDKLISFIDEQLG